MLKYLLLVLISLTSLEAHSVCKSLLDAQKKEIKYAKQFEIKFNEEDKTWWMRVGSKSNFNWYAINTKKTLESFKEKCGNVKLISFPESFLLTSTTQLSAFSDLNAEEKVKAFSRTEMISNLNWKKKLISYPLKPSPELLIRDQIDLVLTYDSDVLGNDDEIKNKNFNNINKIQIIEYLEHHPLARMEWLKVYGLLLNKFNESEKLFKAREDSYWNSIKLIKNKKPIFDKIILGEIYNGKWIYPNEYSDSISILKDLSLEVIRPQLKINKIGPDFYNFEEIITIVPRAQVWITQNIFNSKKKLLKSNHKYNGLMSLRIFNVSQSTNSDGFSDYWETAVNRPDLLIKDYIYFFYPDTLKAYNPLWLNELK